MTRLILLVIGSFFILPVAQRLVRPPAWERTFDTRSSHNYTAISPDGSLLVTGGGTFQVPVSGFCGSWQLERSSVPTESTG
jgi:hypothetical protein